MTAQIEKLGVVGLGIMGFDIAFLYAMKGHATLAYDSSKLAVDSLAERKEQTIERLKKRNRISDDEAANVRRLLTPAPALASLAQVDLITEAVSENPNAKVSVYEALKNAGFKGILTTNTSSLTRASLLAAGTYDRQKFAHTHFFNPVLYTQMVEVVKGDMDETAYDTIISFLRALGRQPVETKDISGFVSNSILMVYAVMAVRLLESGAHIDEVDQAAKDLRLLPPFISFDSWKPSIVEDVTQVMFELRGDTFLRSSRLLSILAKENPQFYVEQKPNAKIYGLLGATSGQSSGLVNQALQLAILIAAARTVELGESPVTVDFVSTEGLKIPAPLSQIDKKGAGAVIEELSTINRAISGEPLIAPQLLTAMARDRQTFFKGDQPNPRLVSYIEHARY